MGVGGLRAVAGIDDAALVVETDKMVRGRGRAGGLLWGTPAADAGADADADADADPDPDADPDAAFVRDDNSDDDDDDDEDLAGVRVVEADKIMRRVRACGGEGVVAEKILPDLFRIDA